MKRVGEIHRERRTEDFEPGVPLCAADKNHVVWIHAANLRDEASIEFRESRIQPVLVVIVRDRLVEQIVVEHPAFVAILRREARPDLPPGALGFTFCGMPIVYHCSQANRRLRVPFAAGTPREISGSCLDTSPSAELFSRTGRLARIEVELGADFQPLSS